AVMGLEAPNSAQLSPGCALAAPCRQIESAGGCGYKRRATTGRAHSRGALSVFSAVAGALFASAGKMPAGPTARMAVLQTRPALRQNRRVLLKSLATEERAA